VKGGAAPRNKANYVIIHKTCFLKTIRQGVVGLCVFCPRKNIQRDAVRIAQRKEWNVILEEFEDIEPDNVTLLIRHSSDNYIVFIDGDSEVDYETTDAYDEAHPSHEVRLSTIYNRIEDLEHRPAVQYLSAKNQKALVRLLGNALAAELDMAQSEADKTIQMAEQFLKQRTIEISRRWLLLSAFGAAAISLALWHWLMPKDFLFFGCLGAFFSILCKTGKLDYDCEAGMFLNILEVISRFFAAMISAYLAGKLFEADLLFTALREIKTVSVLPFIYFAAGFSERLIPSIVTTLGGKEKYEA
jgi:hypothetical protein